MDSTRRLSVVAAFLVLAGVAIYRTTQVRKQQKTSSARSVLRSLPSLQNVYFAIRHGESEANVTCVVSSDKVLATKQHGLTSKGKEDARRGAEDIAKHLEDMAREVVLIHSPFLRTTQTAQVVRDVLGSKCSEMRQEVLLCERSFGVFEGKNSHESYNQVWAQDEINGCKENSFECESVYAVSDRAAEVILRCEREFKDKAIVIVSHGDILQIMRSTLIRDMDPKHHRRGEHLNPGQAIRLHLS